MTYLIHRRNPWNTGDWHSGPDRYFPLKGQPVDIQDVMELDLKPEDLVILGGGGLLGQFDKDTIRISESGCRIVLWGVGGNVHGQELHGYATGPATLVGCRDRESTFLPCVSCMDRVWDLKVPISREVGRISHVDFPLVLSDLTNQASIRKLAYYIHGSERIVTTSYHVWYWATLLGKPVELPWKWSSKFFHLRPCLLEEARRLNVEFFQRVCEKFPEVLC